LFGVKGKLPFSRSLVQRRKLIHSPMVAARQQGGQSPISYFLNYFLSIVRKSLAIAVHRMAIQIISWRKS
jgi:hypothetical protein